MTIPSDEQPDAPLLIDLPNEILHRMKELVGSHCMISRDGENGPFLISITDQLTKLVALSRNHYQTEEEASVAWCNALLPILVGYYRPMIWMTYRILLSTILATNPIELRPEDTYNPDLDETDIFQLMAESSELFRNLFVRMLLEFANRTAEG